MTSAEIRLEPAPVATAAAVRVLAGDVGGTNARLAVVEIAGDAMRVVHAEQYPSAEYPGLASIVRRFLRESGAEFERACFGVACPVVEEICETPNLPWRISARALREETGVARTTIINDFEAVGYAIEWLRPDDLVTLQVGERALRGTVALMGAGTGLGQAFLVWSEGRYHVHPSEGGHTTFAAQAPEEWAMATALAREYGHVSYERFLSGSGLLAIYHHLATRAGERGVAPAMAAEVERDGAAAISRHALAGSDPLCVRALDYFAGIYGAQAANLALTVLATGGVYIGGGIAPRILPKLRDGTFLRAFRHKGRLSSFVEKVPVHVITNPEAGILGAAAVASRL